MLPYRLVCVLLLAVCSVRADDEPAAAKTPYERAAVHYENQDFADAGAAYHAVMLDVDAPAASLFAATSSRPTALASRPSLPMSGSLPK